MYHISLYFDDISREYLAKLIKNAAVGSGNTFMLDKEIEPHITIAVDEPLDEPGISQESIYSRINSGLKMKTEVNALGSGRLDICSIGCFKPHVLFLQPVLNDYLIDINRQANELMMHEKMADEYKPGNWMPHISIAKGLSETQMNLAFGNLFANFKRFEAEVVSIGLKDTKGVLPEYRYMLG